MTVWVLLLRGINVGGTGKLPMADLRAMLADLGAQEAQTYIQSGNAVFRGAIDPVSFAQALSDKINATHGHRPRAMVLAASEVKAALATYPFDEGRARPKLAHIWFCSEEPPAPNTEKLTALASDAERFALSGRWFFLDPPDGIGRSKLAAGVEKALGVPATARNLNTVTKLVDMADTLAA